MQDKLEYKISYKQRPVYHVLYHYKYFSVSWYCAILYNCSKPWSLLTE